MQSEQMKTLVETMRKQAPHATESFSKHVEIEKRTLRLELVVSVEDESDYEADLAYDPISHYYTLCLTERNNDTGAVTDLGTVYADQFFEINEAVLMNEEVTPESVFARMKPVLAQ